MRRIVPISLCLLLPALGLAEEREHERAAAAVARGEILSLEVLLQRVGRREDERLIEVEIEREDGRWVYELELMGADGRVRELEVDAATGDILDDD